MKDGIIGHCSCKECHGGYYLRDSHGEIVRDPATHGPFRGSNSESNQQDPEFESRRRFHLWAAEHPEEVEAMTRAVLKENKEYIAKINLQK
jgi:hypothetical protein